MDPIVPQQAYNEIVAHIQTQGGNFPSWYVGITADWDVRLFYDHAVPRTGWTYVVRRCLNGNLAATVRDALMNLGCTGHFIEADQTAVFVYAYLKGPLTDP
jgi:hypothetical protein